jgi:hypothetical protein
VEIRKPLKMLVEDVNVRDYLGDLGIDEKALKK